MQKRLVLFSFYDKEGIVDGYVDYLLKELTTVSEKIIAIVNGKVNEIGYKILSKYADRIIIRENKGFDIGAYTDVILNYLEMEELENWDELIFCNDTFYGPFVSMKDIFKKMENKKIDFWGLNYVDHKVIQFIEAYFLVFRKRILLEGKLRAYLLENINCHENDLRNIYADFENGLFKNLTGLGYIYDTYTNTELCNIYGCASVCMDKYKLPILKKKSMSILYNDYATKINNLCYVDIRTNYDVELIIENARRLYKIDVSASDVHNMGVYVKEKETKMEKSKYSGEDLLEWIGDSSFYIYGAGIIARIIYTLYFKQANNFLGFVISNNEKLTEQVCGHPVYHWDTIKEDSVKVIVGLKLKNTLEVQKVLGKNENYLYLW